MVSEGPRWNGAGSEGDDAPRTPDAVWRKFHGDNEQAIRASAPREPSAQERSAGARNDSAGTESSRRQWRTDPAHSRPMDAVGEVWEAEDRWPGAAWRDMDTPARRRHVGRILAAIAAAALVVGALSLWPSERGVSDGAPDEITSQQSESVLPDGVPTWTGLPSAAPTGTRAPTSRTE